MTEYYDPETYPQSWNYLEPGTVLDKYIIERELAKGGFSSVYLARETANLTQVVIKEYLPRSLAHRSWNNTVVPHNESSNALFMRGRTLFFREAKTLVNLKHPNIVEVINFFQANSTVYMVMNYDYGLGLDKLLRTEGFKMSESFLLSVFRHLLQGIATIHAQQLVHLDIKPANILIRPDINPLLLDFGAIQAYPTQAKNFPARICTKGFSPIEQYDMDENIGPWTDIYAIGATMRTCLDAKVPPSALERFKRDGLKSAVKVYKRNFSEPLLEAIDYAMQVQPQDRPQSVKALQELLSFEA